MSPKTKGAFASLEDKFLVATVDFDAATVASVVDLVRPGKGNVLDAGVTVFGVEHVNVTTGNVMKVTFEVEMEDHLGYAKGDKVDTGYAPSPHVLAYDGHSLP